MGRHLPEVTPAFVAKELERLLDQYNAGTAQLIDAIRSKYVIPYCERTGMRFRAGNGSWSFDNGKGKYMGEWRDASEDLPKRMYELLVTEVAVSRNDLGSLMADYTPTTYKERT